MISKTSWKVGPEMSRLFKENKGKNYLKKPNVALAQAMQIPSMLMIAATSAASIAEQWFEATPVLAFLDTELKFGGTLRKWLNDGVRMSTIMDYVGADIGVTHSIYNEANEHVCIVQVGVEILGGRIKWIKALPLPLSSVVPKGFKTFYVASRVKNCRHYKWRLSLIANNGHGTEITEFYTDESLRIAMHVARELIGRKENLLVVGHVIIFGDPNEAPESIRSDFCKNPSTWKDGYHLVIE